jgi:hypothetical protein
MPLFGRRKPPPAPPAPADPELVPLDVEQAARLRRLVHDELAHRGVESHIFSDHLQTADHEIGLHNLARTIAEEEPARWPQVVAHHLDLMLEPTGSEDLSDDDLQRRVYLRLLQDGPELRSMFPRALHPAPELTVVLCIDYPERVAMVDQSFYEARGGLERWWGAGLANLRDLLDTEDLERFAVGEGDSPLPRFDIVQSDSVYTASLALVLPELLARHSQHDLGRGVLVAVPDRKTILFRVVEGAEALPAIGEMARVAHAGYASAAGALSPHVYLVDAAGWHQLTQTEGDRISILLGDESVRAFDLHDQG